MTQGYTIKIQHDKFGAVLSETFVNPGQFKLFLKLLNGCVEMKQDLTFFNGVDFFVHIPHVKLVDSIITTKLEEYTFTDHILSKSKIEAPITK
jgi:hypothetical protein